MSRPSAVRRALAQYAGFFPLLGALTGFVWLPLLTGDFEHEGLGVVGSRLLASLGKPIGIVVLVQSLYTAMQSVLWLRYRPFTRLGAPAPGPDGLLPQEPEGATTDPCWPKIAVIIPAFNEGPMVERSIRSVIASDYPNDRLEVLVVDDGSRDDTFFYMQRIRREFPEHVRLLRFPGNRGKRAALEAGFRAATAEFAITIDSDSEVEPRTLHAMIAPFLNDEKIGAVAGRVAVLNRDTVISRMLEVQYTLNFDFARAAQSVYRCVAVCPGALSSFRLSVILPHLTEWTNQRFLGRPVNHGEDQALTNIVLRAGYDTVYQSTAVVNTLAPTQYGQMSRMFLRWDRSYIVEGFSFAKFMFSNYRKKHRILPIVHFVISNLRLLLFFYGITQIPTIFTDSAGANANAALALLLSAFFTALYYLRMEQSFRFLYGVLYAIFSVFMLQWILPWALVTVRDERWGTR